MGALSGVGSFSKGLITGYSAGLDIKEKIANRKEKDKNRNQEDEIKKAGTDYMKTQSTANAVDSAPVPVAQPIQQSQPSSPNAGMMDFGLDSIDFVNQEEPQNFAFGGLVSGTANLAKKKLGQRKYAMPLIFNRTTITPRGMGGTQHAIPPSLDGFPSALRYADGGLVAEPDAFPKEIKRLRGDSMVQDPKSFTTQVNYQAGLESVEQPQPQPAQVQAKTNYGKTLSGSFNAMRDKAIEIGRPDLAKDYHDAGFQIRDRMFKENLTGAQRAYQLTGDIGGFVSVYNDAIDDDANIEGYEKTPQGTFILNINDAGNKMQREVSQDDIQRMVMEFSDPAYRYAAERDAQAKRNNKTFETDEEIRKSQGQEAAKVHNVPQGGRLVNSQGLELANNPANPKKERGETDLEFYQRDPKGYAEYKKTGRKADGSSNNGEGGGNESGLKPSERLAALKNLSDITMNRFGTVSDETGKVSPNARSIGVATRSERLFDANPNIPPETLVQIASDGEDGFQVMQRPDGTQYEVPVIKYQDQIYKVGQSTKKPVKQAPVKKQQEANEAKKPTEKPAPSPKQSANKFNMVQEANAGEEANNVGLDTVEKRKKISPQDAQRMMNENAEKRRAMRQKEEIANKNAEQIARDKRKSKQAERQKQANAINSLNKRD